jgi:hypothetical protein
MQLNEVLELEHALACRRMELPDSQAGGRARPSERSESVRWRPGRIEDVVPAMLDAIFSSPEQQHIRLLARQEMQRLLT